MSDIRVKICGLTRSEDVSASVQAGAAYLGFNAYPHTPRYADIDLMRDLALEVPAGIIKVVLVVDGDDALFDELMERVPLDMIQLHGSETPERVTELKTRTGLPVMKALGISDADDLPKIAEYSAVADQLLLDAKPPKGATRPGGNAVTFDWSLLQGLKIPVPWMLAGGLNVDNVTEAIQISGARQVDVSSAVESAPGIKDAARVKDLIAAAKGQS